MSLLLETSLLGAGIKPGSFNSNPDAHINRSQNIQCIRINKPLH